MKTRWTREKVVEAGYEALFSFIYSGLVGSTWSCETIHPQIEVNKVLSWGLYGG